MAQEPKLKVEGSDVPNVLEVEYTLNNSADRDGRPTRLQTFDGLRIRRIADAKTTLADWAKSPAEKNRKSGSVEFFADSGKPMKQFAWKNGFLMSYDLGYNPQADHVEETVVIQAEEVTCGGLKVEMQWADKQ